ncbi:MAG: hypothetical protein KC609_22960 [Myxococcales bacterium]|nr:hypothetical protein [Myxococcales bacterium]
MSLTQRSIPSLLLMISVVAGCTKTATTVIVLDPVKFTVVRENGKKKVLALEAEQLFKQAGREYDDEKFEQSVRTYRLLIKEFPRSTFVIASHYNAALALEALKRYGDAAKHYEIVAKAKRGERDARDSLMRLAFCYDKLERWSGVVSAVDRIDVDKLGLLDRIEAFARRGNAQYKLQALDKALVDFRRVMRTYHDKQYQRVLVGDYWVSQAQFGIGLVYRAKFDRIKFRLPLSSMKDALQQKVSLFLRAQNNFIKAIYLHNNYWAVVAGFHAANLYESFYRDAMEAEVPKTLTQEELEIYYAELKRHVMPLLRRAISIYEKNVRMSVRLGEQNPWVSKSRAQLVRLKTILANYEKTLNAPKQKLKPTRSSIKRRPPKRRTLTDDGAPKSGQPG